MVGFRRLARLFVSVAGFALLAAQGCGNSSNMPKPDAAVEPSPEVEPDQPPDPIDAPVTAIDADIDEDAPSFLAIDSTIDGAVDRAIDGAIDRTVDRTVDRARDESWDEQARETITLSPIPAANIVFGDSFQDGRMDSWQPADPGSGGTLDTDWSIVVGQSGPVYCQGTLDDRTWHISRKSMTPLGDQIVEAIVRIDDFYAATSSYMAAVFARYDFQSDSGYLLALRGDGRAILRKRTQGATASWASGPDLGIVPGHWYTVRLEVVGATVTGFVDGALVMSVTDTAPIASGTVALGTYGATMEVQSVVVAKP